MENRLPNMENTEQSLEKTDDNYKVPNLEKGIAVIEYLSSRSEGETTPEENRTGIAKPDITYNRSAYYFS